MPRIKEVTVSSTGSRGAKGDKGDPGVGWTIGASPPTAAQPEGSLYFATGTGTAYKMLSGVWTPQGTVAAGIADGAVTASKLADGSVIFGKIADGSVTASKLGAVSVTEAKLFPFAVSTSKIADAAVTVAKIAGASATGLAASFVYLRADGQWTKPTVPWDFMSLLARDADYFGGPRLYVVDAQSAPRVITIRDVASSHPPGSDEFVIVALWGEVTVRFQAGVGASLDGQDADTHGPFRIIRQPVANGLGDSAKGCVRLGGARQGSNAWYCMSGTVEATR